MIAFLLVAVLWHQMNELHDDPCRPMIDDVVPLMCGRAPAPQAAGQITGASLGVLAPFFRGPGDYGRAARMAEERRQAALLWGQ